MDGTCDDISGLSRTMLHRLTTRLLMAPQSSIALRGPVYGRGPRPEGERAVSGDTHVKGPSLQLTRSLSRRVLDGTPQNKVLQIRRTAVASKRAW
jgi:hypothetical protein